MDPFAKNLLEEHRSQSQGVPLITDYAKIIQRLSLCSLVFK